MLFRARGRLGWGTRGGSGSRLERFVLRLDRSGCSDPAHVLSRSNGCGRSGGIWDRLCRSPFEVVAASTWSGWRFDDLPKPVICS